MVSLRGVLALLLLGAFLAEAHPLSLETRRTLAHEAVRNHTVKHADAPFFPGECTVCEIAVDLIVAGINSNQSLQILEAIAIPVDLEDRAALVKAANTCAAAHAYCPFCRAG